MATIMEMPKLSDTMTEGAVARWLKKEGEKVTTGIPIIEIDTDKATMEYESPASGVLLKIIVGDGQKCALNAPIAVIGKTDENWQEALEKHGAKKAPTPQAKPTKTPQNISKQETTEETSSSTNNETSTTAIKASPLAKKIAQDKGINLSSVKGSGPLGRIVQRDLESMEQQPAFASTSVSGPDFIKIPHTNMRKTIARRLSESVNTAPHFYLTVSINMTDILSWRKETLAKVSEEQHFSVNDLIVFIVSRALKKHPFLNASWQEDGIVQYRNVHMSIAVALPGGLMTPVVREANQLSLIQIAKETKRLIKLAKDGKLQPNDYVGGTFSISNLGMSGIENFTAIINPPQAAILAVGSTLSTPVDSSNGSIHFENRMKVTLSCDHRVIDGAVGADFLKTLKQYFEDPRSALFLS